MDRLLEILQSLRSGALAPENLPAALDPVLADEGFDRQAALQVVAGEHAAGTLSPQAYAIIHHRLTAGQAGPGGSPIPGPIDAGDATTLDTTGPVAPPADDSGDPTSVTGTSDVGGPADPRPGGGGDGATVTVNQGDTIKGRFVLEQHLGAGGMGDVYKALDLRKLEAEDRNPYVAIKVLNEEFRSHPESLMTLQREAKRSQGLAHPNIVTVYDFDREGSTIYLTMEYLVGAPLDRKVRSPGFKGMPFDEAMHIVNQVGDALAFAHENGIVHCDLKPGNIFVTDSGQIKVIDFGISRPVSTEDADETRFDAGALGALTPAYASPELIEDNVAGAKSDIYAFACIACELMSGKHPYGRIEATKARDGGLAPTIPANLSRRQARGLERALAFDAESRTPSVRELLADLNASGGTGSRKWVAMGAAAAVLLVAVGGGTYLLMDRGVDRDTAENVIPAPPEPSPPPEPKPPDEQRVVIPAPPPKPITQPPAQPDLSRAEVARILGRISCAKLNFSLRRGAVEVSGYVRRGAELENAKKSIMTLGGATGFTARTRPISAAQCALMDLYAPYAAINQNLDFGLKIRTSNADGEYRESESLILDLDTPIRESFIYIDYFTLDGSVVHMRPNPNVALRSTPASERRRLGNDPTFSQWTVGPPFGVEMITALATRKPLFKGHREEVEPAEDYLRALKQNLKKLVDAGGEVPVAGDLLFLRTAPLP